MAKKSKMPKYEMHSPSIPMRSFALSTIISKKNTNDSVKGGEVILVPNTKQKPLGNKEAVLNEK